MRFLFPARTTQIILHTSGITRRIRELPNFSGVEVIEIDDFSIQAPYINKPNQLFLRRHRDFTSKLKSTTKHFLNNLGFINDLNSEKEWLRICPWILSSRGHYSQIQLTEPDLASVYKLLLGVSGTRLSGNARPDEAVVHVRLGDLISLKTEALDFLPKLTRELDQLYSSNSIRIYSDSNLRDVEKKLGVLPNNAILEQGVSALGVISNSLLSRNFIGSNSKISFWIAALRVHLGTGDSTLIPSNMFTWLSKSLPHYNLEALGVREY
jgi:hypothetical protein